VDWFPSQTPAFQNTSTGFQHLSTAKAAIGFKKHSTAERVGG